jgi:hypothetical protein
MLPDPSHAPRTSPQIAVSRTKARSPLQESSAPSLFSAACPAEHSPGSEKPANKPESVRLFQSSESTRFTRIA